MRVEAVEHGRYESEIKDLMFEIRNDFIPPLQRERDVLADDESPDDFTAREMIDNVFETCAEDGVFVVAKKDGDVVGFLLVKKHFISDYQDEFPFDSSTYMFYAGVHPDYRESGVATAMARKLLDDVMPSIDEDVVAGRTQSQNVASQRFFESLGFEVVHVVENGVAEEINGEYQGDLLYYAKFLE